MTSINNDNGINTGMNIKKINNTDLAVATFEKFFGKEFSNFLFPVGGKDESEDETTLTPVTTSETKDTEDTKGNEGFSFNFSVDQVMEMMQFFMSFIQEIINNVTGKNDETTVTDDQAPSVGETPSIDATTPTTDVKASANNTTTPKADVKTPENDATIPKSDIKTPESDATTPKADVKTPENDATTPTTDATTATNATTGASNAGANQEVGKIPSVKEYGEMLPDNSPVDAQGNPHLVDPNKPINVPFDEKTGTYNPRAAAFVSQQCASTSGMTLDEAQELGKKEGKNTPGDAGTDGGTWKMANGPAKDVLYSAAMIGAAAYKGYTSAKDQANVVAWPNVETGETGKVDGRRNWTQQAGTGVAQGGQGPVQLTPPYRFIQGANNPAVAAVEALTAGEQMNGGGKQANAKAAIIPYNSGVPHDTVGQSEGARGSYADYMETVTKLLNWPTA